MMPTKEEIREIIADMPNWETLEHLFGYVIEHWEQIKHRKYIKQMSVYYEVEKQMYEKMSKENREFLEKCILPCYKHKGSKKK